MDFYQTLKALDAVWRVLRREKSISVHKYPESVAFEKKCTDFLGAEHCIGVGSGTDALIYALKLLGITHEDEVIVPAFGFVGTAFAVRWIGATPVFVDVTSEDYTLDPVQIEKALSSRTKAIIAVHAFGAVADLSSILSIANQRSLAVIEDAAQAFGAKADGVYAGTQGAIGCFSFSNFITVHLHD